VARSARDLWPARVRHRPAECTTTYLSSWTDEDALGAPASAFVGSRATSRASDADGLDVVTVRWPSRVGGACPEAGSRTMPGGHRSLRGAIIVES